MKNLQIIGHLGDDAKTVDTKSKDFHTIMFSVAHTEKFKNKDGKEIEKTDWVTCFKRYKKDPKKVLEFLTKGTKVYVDGKPTFSMNTSNNGGVYVNISIDVHNLDFTTKQEQNAN